MPADVPGQNLRTRIIYCCLLVGLLWLPGCARIFPSVRLKPAVCEACPPPVGCAELLIAEGSELLAHHAAKVPQAPPEPATPLPKFHPVPTRPVFEPQGHAPIEFLIPVPDADQLLQPPTPLRPMAPPGTSGGASETLPPPENGVQDPDNVPPERWRDAVPAAPLPGGADQRSASSSRTWTARGIVDRNASGSLQTGPIAAAGGSVSRRRQDVQARWLDDSEP